MAKQKKQRENKEKIAIALEYSPENEAPVVIATGKGVLADKILDAAGQEDIPVYQDEKLAKTLSKLELGEMIPEELYGAVAEILVFVDRMDRIKAKVMNYKK